MRGRQLWKGAFPARPGRRAEAEPLQELLVAWLRRATPNGPWQLDARPDANPSRISPWEVECLRPSDTIEVDLQRQWQAHTSKPAVHYGQDQFQAAVSSAIVDTLTSLHRKVMMVLPSGSQRELSSACVGVQTRRSLDGLRTLVRMMGSRHDNRFVCWGTNPIARVRSSGRG